MKKTILLSLSLPILVTPLISAVSCSSSSSNYKEMEWAINQDKINQLSSIFKEFNQEPITIDKIKKITLGTSYSRYTTEAIDGGWFQRIEFETNKDGTKATKLVVELKKEQTINDKVKKCPYRLSNGSLIMTKSVKV